MQRPKTANSQSLSGALCLVGGGLAILGSILPFARDCSSCRIWAPTGVSFEVWLPSAVASFLIVLIALVLGIRLLGQRAGEDYVTGILLATGGLGVAELLPYAVHVRFPGGGVIGIGGAVGMVGGLSILVAGLAHTRAGRIGPSAD